MNTVRFSVAALNAIPTGDPEEAHALADAVLLAAVDEEVRDAYLLLVSRCRWWVTA